MQDGRPFFMAGLWSEAPDPATGEVGDTYTLIITDANAAMRVHDRMPVILGTAAARRWIEPGPLPAELLVPYPAEEMHGLARRRRRQEQPDRAAPRHGGAVAGGMRPAVARTSRSARPERREGSGSYRARAASSRISCSCYPRGVIRVDVSCQ